MSTTQVEFVRHVYWPWPVLFWDSQWEFRSGSWTEYRNSPILNIINAVNMNFPVYTISLNEFLVIERGKIDYLHWHSCYQAHQNSKRKSHKITRELSWLLKKTTGKHADVFYLVLIYIRLVCSTWIKKSFYLKEVKYKIDLFRPKSVALKN